MAYSSVNRTDLVKKMEKVLATWPHPDKDLPLLGMNDKEVEMARKARISKKTQILLGDVEQVDNV